MRSDKTLKKWYNSFNRRWFGGRLPGDTVVRWIPERSHLGATDKEGGRFIITLSHPLRKDMYWRMVRFVLLHEMCHVKTWGRPGDDHGKHFQREMLRLARRGAFADFW